MAINGLAVFFPSGPFFLPVYRCFDVVFSLSLHPARHGKDARARVSGDGWGQRSGLSKVVASTGCEKFSLVLVNKALVPDRVRFDKCMQ